MSRLDNLIDQFLEDYRESHRGSWAKITPEDVTLLGEIVRELIELKCDKDANGDYPIEARLINRRVYESLRFYALPYKETPDGQEVPFKERLRLAQTNVSMAACRLEAVASEFYWDQLMNDFTWIPLVEARDLPLDVVMYCTDQEYSLHCDSGIVQVDLRDGNPLADWLLRQGYNVTLVDEHRGYALIALEGP